MNTRRLNMVLTAFATAGIALALALRYGAETDPRISQRILLVTLVAGGLPVLWSLARRIWSRDFGADILAAISMVVALALGEYLAGCIVLLMLTGGQWLEQ